MNILFSKFSNSDSSGKKWLPFLCLISIVILWYVLVEPRYSGDDETFSLYARELANRGPISRDMDHFGLRWMAYIPAGVLYSIFGINDFTTTITCFLATIFTGYLLHLQIRKYEFKTYFLILIMFFLSYSVIFYSKRILADPLVSLFIFSSFICYYKFQFHKGSKFKNFIPVISALSFFLAFLSKETVILILPLYAYYFIRDLTRKNYDFWKLFSGSSIVLFFIYFLLFKLTTDDWFYRFNLIYQHSYIDNCAFEALPISHTLKRIGYGLLYWFLINGDMLIYGPALLYGIVQRKKLAGHSFNTFMYNCFVVLFLSSNFMTVSYKAYKPLCPDPRHFLFLMPFAAVCAGNVMLQFLINPRGNKLVLILFGGLALCAMVFRLGETKYLYLLFFLFMGCYYLYKDRLRDHSRLSLGIAGILLLLLIHPIWDIFKALRLLL